MAQSVIHLTPAMFAERERVLVESTETGLAASTFRFDSGVCGLRLRSSQLGADTGELVLLPFQGQQVWSVVFKDRDLTMRSVFDQPYPTRVFLDTFGGFMQHCGITGVGSPGPKDTHPLHGELPNAPYGEAYIVIGEDESGAYIGLGGRYRHTVAFSHAYVAEPLAKLYAGSTLFNASMSITNLKRSDQVLMYLAHVNFRPVDNGRLIYAARPTSEHVRVRSSIPSHISPGPGYVEFIEELGRHPEAHHVLAPGMAFDPEAVFFIDYLADATGWAHSMQLHPDGNVDYIGHRPDQLPKGTRWISRTADQDAIAIVEAGTCEPEGFFAEREKGNVKYLAPGATFRADFRIGSLSQDEAAGIADTIEALISA